MLRLNHLTPLVPFTLLLALGACSGVGIEPDELDAASDGETPSDEEDWGGDGDGDGGEDEGDAGDGDEAEPPDAEDPRSPEPEPEPEEPICNDVDDVVLYLSPDDSNSMSSPVQVRERVLVDGLGVGPVAIRPWEFMNYYSFDYAPAEAQTLALSAELRGLEGFPEPELGYQLQLAVTSEHMTQDERLPMVITLVLDSSGSMSGEPMELLRESCRAIAASLRQGDKVSMVEWDTGNTWSLAGYAVDGPNDPVLLDKIEQLEAGGGTDLNGGLSSGYELAQQTWEVNALNRLVLISDGGANAGVTAVDLIADNAVFAGSDGIYLVGAGVDLSGTYNDDLMDVVTDAGKGASVFITDEDEAWKIFNEDFINTMGLAARNVQVELTMPPGFEIVKFSGEEFSGDPQEVEPQHLSPNDSMVFHQQIVTCAPELAEDDAELTVTATWEDVTTSQSVEISQTYSFGELLAADASRMTKGAAIVAYTDALIAIKKGDAAGTQIAIDGAYAAIQAAEAVLPGDPDLAEIRAIMDALSA